MTEDFACVYGWLVWHEGNHPSREVDPNGDDVVRPSVRRPAASVSISASANPRVVQRMIGHASVAMTLDLYADLYDSDLASVAESVT